MLRKIYFFVHFFVFKQGEEKKPKLCNCITRTAQGTILFQPGGNGIFCSIMWPQKGNSFQNKRLCQNKSPAIFLRSLENYLAIRIMAQCCSPDNRGTKPQQPGEQEANICWDWPLLLFFLFLFKLHTHKKKTLKVLAFHSGQSAKTRRFKWRFQLYEELGNRQPPYKRRKETGEKWTEKADTLFKTQQHTPIWTNPDTWKTKQIQ